MKSQIIVKKYGEVAEGYFNSQAALERVGDICVCEIKGVRLEIFGELKKFTQSAKCESIRKAKVAIKKMVTMAFDDSALDANNFTPLEFTEIG